MVYTPNMNEAAKREKALQSLEQYVKEDYKIFIDTCSLLHDKSDLFWQNIIPFLDQYHKKVIIQKKCVDELYKHQSNESKLDLAKKARNALKLIQQLINSEYVDIRGEASDQFADNVFLTVFTKFRMEYKLLLITQDHDLADEISALNDSGAVKFKKAIVVKQINKYGFLSNIVKNDVSTENYEKHTVTEKPISEEEKFEYTSHLTSIPDDTVSVSDIPEEREEVFVEINGEFKGIRLLEKLGSGGEANIYSTNTHYVAKIYRAGKLTKRKCEKIKLMISKKINCDGICYPVASVYNKSHDYVGFLMPPAKGYELQRSLFIKPRFMQIFPSWKKRDTVELCVTILKMIKYLHDRNIIMGDINPANIMVVSPREVYFVDTDSYQVEGFPCPVGTINYTAPEIQNKRFETFMRTFGNENFAVATLLFMIMLPGKPPYSQQGGEDQITNIMNGDFSYPFGDNSNKKTPDGPWRFIWSHLPYDIKRSFYTTFRKNLPRNIKETSHYEEKSRLSVDEWLSQFEYYLKLLDSGKFGEQDKMSEDLYPTRFKKNNNQPYVKCILCKEEVSEGSCKNGICRNCLSKTISVYKCTRCKKEITYTNYHKYIKKAKPYTLCNDCYEWGNKVYSTQSCSDCGRLFDITNKEYEFYVSKGLDIPKRCKKCRELKKASAKTQQSSLPNKTDTTSSCEQNHGRLCFLTTAVCEYLGKPDDCEELTKLREFRDNWLKKQPDGEELIAEYYRLAPLIVSKMKQSPHYSEYCEKLYSQYITPCLNLITQHKNEECKILYTKMFLFMKAEFVN